MVTPPKQQDDHRKDQLRTITIDHSQLTDLRALQRTFDGAYARTALGQLSYAIVILRLFDRSFYWCGLAYTVQAAQLIVIAIYRYNLAMANNDRWSDVTMAPMQPDGSSVSAAIPSAAFTVTSTEPQQAPIFRRTFRTAGNVVALATACTFAVEVALIVLVIKM